jgi:hypothetical protein
MPARAPAVNFIFAAIFLMPSVAKMQPITKANQASACGSILPRVSYG